jgi:hypothetical protein
MSRTLDVLHHVSRSQSGTGCTLIGAFFLPKSKINIASPRRRVLHPKPAKSWERALMKKEKKLESEDLPLERNIEHRNEGTSKKKFHYRGTGEMFYNEVPCFGFIMKFHTHKSSSVIKKLIIDDVISSYRKFPSKCPSN